MEELLILHETEFQILATAVGLTRLYGVQPKENPQEADLLYTIHEMAQRGILIRHGEKLSLNEPYRNILEGIKEAQKILSITVYDEKMSNICFYLGSKIVSLEKSRQDKNAIKLGLFEKDTLYDRLLDRDVLPQSFWQPDIADLQLKKGVTKEKQESAIEYSLMTSIWQHPTVQKEYTLLKGFNYYREESQSSQNTELQCYERDRFFKQLLNDIEA